MPQSRHSTGARAQAPCPPAGPDDPAADAPHEGAGATTSLDCKGGTARVEGAGNAVTVELAAGGSIAVAGESNAVVWTTPDGSKPKIRSEGFGNLVRPAQ